MTPICLSASSIFPSAIPSNVFFGYQQQGANVTESPKLLDKVRELLRLKHYSPKTEESYVNWIRRYVRFHDLKHPREMGTAEVEAFLSHLAVQEKVAASTQNQALSALLFLYREALGIPLDKRLQVVRAEKPELLPTVLSKEEMRKQNRPIVGIRVPAHYSAECVTRRARRKFPSRSVRTPFATVSPPTCSRMAMIFAPFKNCSGTKMFVPQ